jgi:hypothetical protein
MGRGRKSQRLTEIAPGGLINTNGNVIYCSFLQNIAFKEPERTHSYLHIAF